MKIAIIGTGANGSCIAADLTNAGLDVTLIDQWPEHVKKMQADGLKITMPNEILETKVKAINLCNVCTLNEKFDYIFIIVKAYDTRWICSLIEPYLSENGLAIGLQNGMTLGSVTFEEAMKLFDFPKTVGQFEGEEVVVAQGRYGPYVKFKEMFVSIPSEEDISSVEVERAIELIKEKQQADAPIAEHEGLPVQKGTGRFGPFIKWNSMFINVSRKYDFDNLSNDDIVELIEIKKQKEIDKYIHRWDDKGISLQKARWGRFNIIKGKIKIELPKETNVEAMTLSDVEKIIEARAPKKKAKAKAKPKAKKKK